jgi:hypothetical protein
MFKYFRPWTDELSVQQARINKTNYFWNNKNGFLWELSKEIELLKKRAARDGFKFAVRLNGTSDLPWFKYKVDGGGSLWIFTQMFNFMIIPKY